MALIDLDSEQAALIEAGLNAIDAVLSARLARADPDKIISSSLGLQRRKVLNLREQLGRPPRREWSDLPGSVQSTVLRLAKTLGETTDGELASTCWQKLVAYAIAGGPRPTDGPLISWLDQHPEGK